MSNTQKEHQIKRGREILENTAEEIFGPELAAAFLKFLSNKLGERLNEFYTQIFSIGGYQSPKIKRVFVEVLFSGLTAEGLPKDLSTDEFKISLADFLNQLAGIEEE